MAQVKVEAIASEVLPIPVSAAALTAVITSGGTIPVVETSAVSIVSGGTIPVNATSAVSVRVGDGTNFAEVLCGVAAHYYLGTALIQDVHADTKNSSPAGFQLSAGNTYTFEGTASNTLGVAGLQVSLFANQNCIVYVEQSPEGTNWDISDPFYYTANKNFGVTVQAVSSYYRVKVTSTTTTTTFRLQSCLCPIVEALPRTTDHWGNLKVSLKEDQLGYGPASYTPNQEMLTSPRYRLVGSQFQGTGLDSNYWLSASSTATLGMSGASVYLSSGTANGHSASVYSKRAARFVTGATNKYRCHLVLEDTGTANIKRRWGVGWGASMPTITDGAWFELSGATFQCITSIGGTETSAANGSLNGHYGYTLTVPTTNSTWEIIITNGGCLFICNGILVHNMKATTGPWTNTLHLHAFMDVKNTGNSSKQSMWFRTAHVARMGQLVTQPTSYYTAATTLTGTNLKAGSGNLQSVMVMNVTNNAFVTLWDNTTSGGTVLWGSGPMGAQTQPLALDMKGIPFFTGLTLTITAANAGVLVIYE